jgi:hypothetical protein
MNAKRNWKTTVFGILMLALSGFTIYNDPSKATDPQSAGDRGWPVAAHSGRHRDQLVRRPPACRDAVETKGRHLRA